MIQENKVQNKIIKYNFIVPHMCDVKTKQNPTYVNMIMFIVNSYWKWIKKNCVVIIM